MSVNIALVKISHEDLEWLRNTDAETLSLSDDRTDAWFWKDDPRAFELEKRFFAIHYLLTGADAEASTFPLGFIANEQLGEAVRYEFTYGPGRVYSPEQVAEISDAFNELAREVLEERMSSAALANIYPFRGELLQEDKDDLFATLGDLENYMRSAKAENTWMLVATL